MAENLVGRTLLLKNKPAAIAYAGVVGKKEGEGPLRTHFDKVVEDSMMGQDSWEKAESMFQKEAVEIALTKANADPNKINCVFAGDLLNQCVGSSFGLRDFGIPFVGLYGACSTMALSSCLASVFVDRGAADCALAVTSSHFCSAERQFRFPLTYGGQRTPTSQWTVTGSGAILFGHGEDEPYVDAVTIGRIVDLGINDINNMGAAMAPAAADTILAFLKDTGTKAEDYDLILTGDLGYVGSELLVELLQKEGVDISKPHNDCGKMIFNREGQDVHAGGSGCGCAASVFSGYILPLMKKKQLRNVLLCATGALMSTVTDQQGETIPAVAHLLNFKS